MIYFDNAATSFPKPESVVKAVSDFMQIGCANPGRAGHSMSVDTARMIFETRELLAEFFNTEDSRNVIFTQNSTMSLNMVIQSILKDGDCVITTSMEHNSVMRPLRFLEEKKSIKVIVVKAKKNGVVCPETFIKELRSDARLIIINHCSNVNGAVNDIGTIVQGIRNVCGAVPIMIDASQSAGSVKIDFKSLDIDFLAFTGHKALMGPQGTGGLIIRNDGMLDPFVMGGTGSRSEYEIQPDFLPDRFESGTMNSPGIAGLGGAIRFINGIGLDVIIEKKEKLCRRLLDGLLTVEGCRIYGKNLKTNRCGVISFNLAGIPSSGVGQVLNDEYQVFVRTGLHCAPSAHRTLGTYPDGTVRVSPGYFNTNDDIDMFLDYIREISVANEF